MSILKIRDENGNVQEIIAIKGDNGYTPVKGKDYWTNADKEEIVNSVISALPVYNGEVV